MIKPSNEKIEWNSGDSFEGKKKIGFFQNVCVVSLSGMIGISIIQPLIYFKNMKQSTFPQTVEMSKLEKEIKSKFKFFKIIPRWYRGLGGNVATFTPIVAFQTATSGGLSGLMDPLLAATIAGVFSAVIDCPAEGIMIQQQKTGRSFRETVSTINKSYGKSAFFRGIVPTMVREGAFTAAYLGVVPLLKAKLKEKEIKEWQALIFAGTVAGTLAAVISHPFDTNKTQRQGDYSLKVPLKTSILKKHAFAGIGWRIAMVVSLITIMTFFQESFNSKIEELEEKKSKKL